MKRQRMMGPPEGFIVNKPPPKPMKVITELPKFSGFENSSASASRSALDSAGPSNPRRSNALASARPIPVFNIPGPPNTRPLRALKPPVLAAPLPAVNMAKQPESKRIASLGSFRPIFSDIPQSAGPSKPLHNPLHNIPVVPERLQTPLSNSLKPLPPPPVIANRKADLTKPQVSIMQTEIARATDFRTEAGTAEILSIFLQQHGSGYVDPLEREMSRGLEQSPEKRRKTKDPKYLRWVSHAPV
jgi:hypothetical protein